MADDYKIYWTRRSDPTLVFTDDVWASDVLDAISELKREYAEEQIEMGDIIVLEVYLSARHD